MKALVVSIVSLVAGTAAADPSFEVLDRGTTIEVIAHDVKAAKTIVNPVRSRLEIDVTGSPHAVPLVPTTSAVKVVEFDGQPSRVLSVKLPFERPQVKQMAKFAQAIQVGDDLHLLFPKELPAEGAKVVLPEPTVPAALEARAKAMAPAITPAAPFGPQKPRTDKAPMAEPTSAATTNPTAPAEAKPEPAKKKDDKFLADEEPSSNASMYAMMGLGALGLGAWMLKKRKKTTGAPASNIEMIAQRSLGSKAKVVWLAAGGREMVVAVTAQNVRMLGQWKKGEGATSSSSMTALPEATAFENRPRERAVTNSPVAGILKLRERMPTNKVEVELLDEEIATGDLDADAIWAKEILAASGGRR